MKHVEQLMALGACLPAVEWANTQPDWAACWANCPRGDWLLWTPGLDHKKLVLAACGCARLVLHLVPEGEDRPRVAIETTEAWARGEATLTEVEAASNAAAAEAWAWAACTVAKSARSAAAAANAVAKSARSAAAANAVWAAAEAAWWSEAANAAWAAAEAGAYARVAMHLQCADIVRSFFPKAPDLAAIVREATA